MSDYTKLGDLDGQTFTIDEAYGFQFKKWDAEARRMLTSDRWEDGFRKIYTVSSNKGKFDLSAPQMKDLLESTYSKGTANIVGKSFTVKKVIGQNDIPKYYFKLVKEARQEAPAWEAQRAKVDAKRVEQAGLDVAPTDVPDEVDLSDIPF